MMHSMIHGLRPVRLVRVTARDDKSERNRSDASGEASLWVEALTRGEEGAEAALFEVVYSELRQLARSFLQRERSDHTLQSTALIHEAWIRLVDQDRLAWQGRNHFFAVAALAMRRVLIDHARAHTAERRGGGAPRQSLATELGVSLREDSGDVWTQVDLLTLHEGLERLADRSERAARIVEMRFFGGMTEKDVAEVLGIASSTVTLEWKASRAWLSSWMNRGDSA